MKRKYTKRIKEIYKIYCEVEHYGQFTERLSYKYEPEVISGMWDFFTDY